MNVYCEMNTVTKTGCIVSETHLKVKSNKNQSNQIDILVQYKYFFCGRCSRGGCPARKISTGTGPNTPKGFGDVGDEHWLGENVFV